MPPESARLALAPIPDEQAFEKLRSTHGLFYTLGYFGHPAGACFGKPRDVVKILQLHVNGGEWAGQRLIERNALREMHTIQYQAQIDKARVAGQSPVHEPWGLGPLVRGKSGAHPGHQWFGMHDQQSPTLFGHVGISTIMGNGDPANQLAYVFLTTNEPKPDGAKAIAIRNGVTNRIFDAIG